MAINKRRKRSNPALEKRIDELVRSAGIGRAMATQVAMGRMELNDVLKRMAHKALVESLMRRHDFTRALASQIALGQADLDRVLFKRRMADHLQRHAERSILLEAEASRKPLSLALHGQRGADGLVSDVGAYEFLFNPRKGEPETIHKLQVKFAVDANDRKKLRKSLSYDKRFRKGPKEPIWKPQDRYSCSNRRLFTDMDSACVVSVLLMEGEVLRGTIVWVGRYEFGLEVKGGVQVAVFRHALAKLVEA